MCKEPTITGLLFSCPRGQEMKLVNDYVQHIQNRPVQNDTECPIDIHAHTTFPIEVTLPCNYTVILESQEDLMEDMPCPCGDPNHWIIRWDVHPFSRN